MAEALAVKLDLRITGVSLVAKLDAIGAALAAVREAHRDQMPQSCWQQLHLAQEAIVRAMLQANESPAGEPRRLTENHEGDSMRRIAKPAITTNTTLAAVGFDPASPGGDKSCLVFIDATGDVVHVEFSGGSA